MWPDTTVHISGSPDSTPITMPENETIAVYLLRLRQPMVPALKASGGDAHDIRRITTTTNSSLRQPRYISREHFCLTAVTLAFLRGQLFLDAQGSESQDPPLALKQRISGPTFEGASSRGGGGEDQVQIWLLRGRKVSLVYSTKFCRNPLSEHEAIEVGGKCSRSTRIGKMLFNVFYLECPYPCAIEGERAELRSLDPDIVIRLRREQDLPLLLFNSVVVRFDSNFHLCPIFRRSIANNLEDIQFAWPREVVVVVWGQESETGHRRIV
ncbi:hypothetical protein PM082_016550 [Marasmius tenuissimus]|nr:hypothetical protein PM082_016550 [Marasmius tenuissimus]